MSVYQESGVEITLSGLDHHRFSELSTYKVLSGQNIKEVDYCWLQSTAKNTIPANTLIGLELKGYKETAIPVDKLFNNLLQKIRDTLAMFSAAWLQQGLGSQIHNELPTSYRSFSIDRKIVSPLNRRETVTPAQ
jgi:hypothetical protein